MVRNKQQIRRSQFVTTYGPGSIIEGPHGSRLIPSLKGLGKNFNDSFLKKYEIVDTRMNQMIDDMNENENYESHLIAIPSNDAVQDEEKEYEIRYSTILFPEWHICYGRKPPILYRHYIKNEFDEDGNKLPISKKICYPYDEDLCINCERNNNPNVRFIRACPNGHMDEIDWYMEVHRNKWSDNCKSGFFEWHVNGTNLEDIVIKCPDCGAETDMNLIYKFHNDLDLNYYQERCTGRFIEKEELRGYGVCNYRHDFNLKKESCDQRMRVLQRQSSSLRLPNTRTLLKIPPYDKPVLDTLSNRRFKEYLSVRKEDYDEGLGVPSEEVVLKKARKTLKDINKFKELKKYLKENTVLDLLDLVAEVENREYTDRVGYADSIEEEFLALRKNENSANFSKSKSYDYILKGLDYEFPLKVYGLGKLSTVTVQLSYQRKPGKFESEFESEDFPNISVGCVDEETKKEWYPAFMGVGEGIFITSDEDMYPFEEIDRLKKFAIDWEINPPAVSDGDRKEIKTPYFIWWHTLSHAILKSLSLSCGYSAASLNERVFFIPENGEPNRAETKKGGILIYNTSPGDDSGMGGLVDIVSDKLEFNKVLENAMNNLLVCSNDPLCASTKHENDSVNGAACHNCLLVSETSCEHLNTLLDRNLFI